MYLIIGTLKSQLNEQRIQIASEQTHLFLPSVWASGDLSRIGTLGMFQWLIEQPRPVQLLRSKNLGFIKNVVYRKQCNENILNIYFVSLVIL